MKKTVLISLALFSTLCVNAQQQFDYEAISLDGAGYIVLASGDSIKGALTYRPNKHESVLIQINPTDKKKQEYKPSQVRSFGFTELKRTFEAHQEKYESGKTADSSFYELLNPQHSNFKIFKLFRSGGKIEGGKLEGIESYFIWIKDHLSIAMIGGKTLRPFNEALPQYLSDCPALQNKVKNEEDGYKMPALTNNGRRVSILLKIADEYETCGK